jgi:hypothetical protein
LNPFWLSVKKLYHALCPIQSFITALLILLCRGARLPLLCNLQTLTPLVQCRHFIRLIIELYMPVLHPEVKVVRVLHVSARLLDQTNLFKIVFVRIETTLSRRRNIAQFYCECIILSIVKPLCPC